MGVTKGDLPIFTQNVMTEQTQLTANNYVTLEEQDVLEIYQGLHGRKAHYKITENCI